MAKAVIHRFEQNGRRFAIDPETCFCFECDEISWDVLEYYPFTPVNRIYHELGHKHDPKELAEVIGELEWLRATKSIVPIAKLEDLKKQFEIEPGLKRLVVRLPRATEPAPAKRGWFGQGATVHSNSAREAGLAAVELLLTRSESQKELHLEFMEEGGISNPDLIAELCAKALRSATLAGKRLSAAVHVTDVKLVKAPAALEGHGIAVKMEFQSGAETGEPLRALARALAEPALARLVKTLNPGTEGVTGRIIVRPSHQDFGKVVEELDGAGFPVIELDLEGSYIENPALVPAAMLQGLTQSAVYYAQRLLKNHYFRLDPIAYLFWRIYDGSPLRRADALGTHELAVDADGSVYPSWRLLGISEFRLGSLSDGKLDEDAVRRYEDYGTVSASECRQCWARNLCGGGTAAVHRALAGSIRQPHLAWCEAQRAWLGAAVAAFNLLSSQGVNFTRVYGSLTRSSKPSLFTMLRAAIGMTVGMRPIDEADAEMLVRWENWNRSAYFLCNESGILLATKYDREMDSLHPQGVELETILTRKAGGDIGLLRIRPEPRFPGTASGWLYLRKDEDYRSDEIRKGFRFLLKQAGSQQSIRKVTVPATQHETALQEFLTAVGFQKVGTQREALYLHGKYHDVDVFSVNLDKL